MAEKMANLVKSGGNMRSRVLAEADGNTFIQHKLYSLYTYAKAWADEHPNEVHKLAIYAGGSMGWNIFICNTIWNDDLYFNMPLGMGANGWYFSQCRLSTTLANNTQTYATVNAPSTIAYADISAEVNSTIYKLVVLE